MVDEHFIQKTWKLIEELKGARRELGINFPNELNQAYNISNELETLLINLKDKENHNLLHITTQNCKKKCNACLTKI